MPSRVLTERTRTRSNSVADPSFNQFSRNDGPSFGATASRPPSAFVRPNYPHTSIFRSSELVLNLFSPTIKVPRRGGEKNATPLPVYGDHDRVRGSVVLDLPSPQQTGHFTVSITGTFLFHSQGLQYLDGSSVPAGSKQTRHVFYSASHDIPLAPTLDTPSRSMFKIRKTPSRQQLTKTRSMETMNADPPRAYPFDFEIPQPLEVGQEMPPTFSLWNMVQAGPRLRAYSEIGEVSYKVSVAWEAGDGSSERLSVESAILFQPDNNLDDLEGITSTPDAWMEFALHAEHPAAFDCAITVPNPTIFPRSATIPYFVVFKTNPLSHALARSISSTASISVNLIREVTIDPLESQALGLSAPPSPSSSNPSSATHERFLTIPSSEPTSPSPTNANRNSSGSVRKKVWQRMLKSVAPEQNGVAGGDADGDGEDPHASLWTENARPGLLSAGGAGSLGSRYESILREARVLHAESTIGFPKRPRHRSATSASDPGNGRHSSSADLPDGLHKSEIRLDKSMLPTVNWPGVSIKYYLDVSIIFADNSVLGRVPLRIY